MKHPPYHLRVNKAVDRWMLVEVMSILFKHLANFRDYRYYGLGGPFLEDLRLLGEHFTELRLTSLETNEQTYRRQKFHRCAKNVTLKKESVDSFLATNSWEKPAIYWFDYTDLNPTRVQEFQTLLDRAHEDSIVKVTLRASLDDLPDFAISRLPNAADDLLDKWRAKYLTEFMSRFDTLIPPATDYTELRPAKFPALLQKMLRIAAQRALTPGSGRRFQILHSCHYSDHTAMYSLTGVVCRDEDALKYQKMFSVWPLRNLRWRDPKRIDMPILSTKERMLLESLLPARKTTGRALRRELGYNIDDTAPASIRKLQHYAAFYRYYPYFAKVNVV